MAAPLLTASLAASAFWVRMHRPDECDSKGLPLTPNSIRVMGRFQVLRDLRHDNLCSYLDIVKFSNAERMTFVSEYHTDCLENHIQSKNYASCSSLSKVACQILQALDYLHERNVIHRNLSADNVLITLEDEIKLFNYGLYHITEHGKAVNFPIGSPRYLAPEVLLSSPNREPSGEKSDIWSLGILILELYMGSHIHPGLFLQNALPTLFSRTIQLLQNFNRNSVHPLTTLLEMHNCSDLPLDTQLRAFLEACLAPVASSRPSAAELLQHPFIISTIAKVNSNQKKFRVPEIKSPFRDIFRCGKLELPSLSIATSTSSATNGHSTEVDHLQERTLKEVYALWCLAGGDLHGEVQKKVVVKPKPPILRLPSLVIKEGVSYGLEKDAVTLYDSAVTVLPMDQLRTRLQSKCTPDYYPIITDHHECEKKNDLHSFDPQLLESAKLPLAIKERDVEYQFHRIILFSRLLEGYPYTRQQIVTEAVTDVCPLQRAEIWAAILSVKGDIQYTYTSIDKESETPTDRQIAVDIPRCHQYDLLLASPEGHKKFMRILKAWVVSHPQLVYWQGLDSLCAPFLALNFNNEALAFSSMNAFIEKYLRYFFLKDNSSIMQEYLAVFGQIVAYHDPELFNHLDSIGFMPELYAIPWFLTMFTHIFPLHKIYHLWDTLLLGDCSFPIFVGVAILHQLRADLVSFDFNECILMFSDMPDIDIQQCITEAVRMYQITPPSLSVRRYEHLPCQHSDIPPEIRKEPLKLETLKLESSPQISAHDLITINRLTSSALCYADHAPPPHKDLANPLRWQRNADGIEGRKAGVILDIRSKEEYCMGHVPHSLNIPHTEAFASDGSLNPCQSVNALWKQRGRIIVIVANKGDPGAMFARQLVRLNFSQVCLLHGGAGILRSQGLLSSLQDSL